MDFKRNFCSALALAISGSVFAQGFFDNKLGGANSPVSGSASADGAKNAALALEKCEKPFGTIADKVELAPPFVVSPDVKPT